MARFGNLSTDAKRRAQLLIERLGIESPADIDLDYIAWECGAYIREEQLEGLEGRILKMAKQSLISIKKSIPERGKKRFVAAHELGHLVLQHNENQLAVCTNADLLSWYKTNPDERDANVFAAELLMPEKLFVPHCQAAPSLELFESLADRFNSSLTATIIRYVSMTSQRVAVAHTQDRYVKWALESGDFRFEIPPSEALKPETYAAEFFNGQEVTKKFEFVESKAWLDPRRLQPNSFVRELVIPMPTYNSALSVIWIDREIEDDSI